MGEGSVVLNLFVTPNQLGWNNNCYDVVCRNTCYHEAGHNSCNGEAGLNSCYNKTGRYNCYDKAGCISIFLRIFPYGQPNLVIIFIHQANRGAKLTNTCFILTSLCSIIRKLFKHFRKFPLFLRIPTIFLPELRKKLKFRPQVLFLTNVITLLMVRWHIDRKVCILETQRYVKGMYLWKNRYVFIQNR